MERKADKTWKADIPGEPEACLVRVERWDYEHGLVDVYDVEKGLRHHGVKESCLRQEE